MLAGGIPGVCMILYDLARFDRLGTTLEFLFFWYIIVPSSLAAVSGFLLGADILNPDKVRSTRQAGVRGLLVSLAAWLAFAPLLSTITGSAMSFLQKFFFVLVFGTVIFGWLIGGVGIATGLLLFRLRRPHQAM
jgi:hypothetical protein